MIPILLDPARARIALVGRGALALKRLSWLRQAGAAPDVWSDAPSAELLAAAPQLERRLPELADLGAYQAIWIADASPESSETVANAARSANVLVNVEDVARLCDFHTPAVVRRGKLTLAAGTGGASPAAARLAREHLEEAFPERWAHALEEIAEARAILRAQGAGFDALAADARARLGAHGLL